MIKKTYIPGKPRNPKLIPTSTGNYASLRQEINNLKGGADGINQRIDRVSERVDNIKSGTANLLLNTGFLGDFKSLNLDSLTTVLQGTPVNTNPLIHWVHSGISVIDAPSRSGKGVSLIDGSLQQTVNLKAGMQYVLSFWAKGEGLNVAITEDIDIELTDEYTRYSFDITASQTIPYTFAMEGTAKVYEPMLSEGNVDVGYSYSESDDLKVISQLQAINVITDAIKNYDTDILGGLILTSMIQLGKYKDGVMEKVNAGINGIYNNDNDPAFWAGGSFEDAIRTVQKFIDNPNYEPTEAEWAEMANIVMTHGGDGFFRGYIYALGGFFRGKIESNFNGNKIVIDPEDRSLKMFNSNGWLSLSMTFSPSEAGSHNDAKINVYTYKANGEVLYNTQISPGGVSVLSQNEIEGVWITDMTSIYLGGLQVLGYQSDGVDFTKNYEFSIHRNTITPGLDMEISTVGLPTTGDGLPAGMWYIENGFLKVKQ